MRRAVQAWQMSSFAQRLSLCISFTVLAVLFNASFFVTYAQNLNTQFSFEAPEVALAGIPFSQTVESAGPVEAGLELEVAGERYALAPDAFSPTESGLGFEATVEDIQVPAGSFEMRLLQGGETLSEGSSRAILGWLAILPPLIAIAVALITRQVVPALFLGIFVGAVTSYGFSLSGVWLGLLDTLNRYVLEALVPPDGSTGHAAIIVFTLMIGGMVGIISRNGGMKGVVNRITGFASTPKRGQIATSFLGVAIFFDDYANTLVVGNTMRPVTDRLKISREKLAYIVDSTAAPVATIALVTTWIGFEVGLIGDAVSNIQGFDQSAYTIFLNSIPYSFYPILAVLFVFMIAFSGRDYGPMLKAERRARRTGTLMREGASVDEGEEMEPKEGVPERALNAIVPILVLVSVAVIGLFATGEGDNVQDIIGSADSFTSLVWASLLGVLAAALLTVGQRVLTLEETVGAWYGGLKNMLFVIIILILAWSLSGVTDVLHTGDYLVSILGESLAPAALPALIFVVSAATAFATGTSWGTMGILIPLTVPLTWAILQANGLASPEHYAILYASIASVLSGAVWGDHCSPISDTTIISSMASQCDHIDHVRTQLPYALSVGTVGLLVGLLPVGLGAPWWLMLPICALILAGALYVFGQKVEVEEEKQAAPVVAAEAP